MTIGERIKNRRLELNLSVDEVAAKLGKNRATIYRYEKDDIKELPITVLEPLAEVLETTPADLMGWSDEPIEMKYNALSSNNSQNLSRYSDYLYLSERQLINDKNCDEYMDFIIADKICELNSLGKKEAFKRINELTQIPWYSTVSETNAAHERTDIEVTDEMRQHDDDIMDDENF